MSANSFRGAAHQYVDVSPLDFLSVVTLKSLIYSAVPENEETLVQPIFDALPITCSCPGPLRRCGIARSDVSMRELFQLQDILNICYEF